MSCTTARSSPIRRLKSVDLPTFGRPTIATPGIAGPSSTSSGGSISGNSSTSASSRSPVPRPWSAVTANGSPKPSDTNVQMSPRRDSLSTLLATSSTGRLARRSHSETFASSSVTPTVASTTNTTASASRTARSDCALTFASSDDPPGSHPPVSTTVNSVPCHSASNDLRSRVTPGSSCTIASRRPTSLLTSVDLPTFGRPTIATTGRLGLTFMPALRPVRRARPVARAHRSR